MVKYLNNPKRYLISRGVGPIQKGTVTSQYKRDEIVCLFTDLDSLYCTVILYISVDKSYR